MHKKPTKTVNFILITLVFSFFLSGCSWLNPYKQDIQQGNLLDEEAIAQLKTGMSQVQVLYILGTPLLKTPNNPNQWDYIYQLRQSTHLLERETLRLHFSTNPFGELRLSQINHVPAI